MKWYKTLSLFVGLLPRGTWSLLSPNTLYLTLMMLAIVLPNNHRTYELNFGLISV
jgi:hypothetical protein